MISDTIDRLQYILRNIPPRLCTFDEAEMGRVPAPGKWSKKQIIGHLTDSAANNHQRFIRIQYEDIQPLNYDQDKWNELNHYDLWNSKELILFWAAYNQHLLRVVQQIPPEHLSLTYNTGEKAVTLEWLIVDYVRHMQHHLLQIVDHL